MSAQMDKVAALQDGMANTTVWQIKGSGQLGVLKAREPDGCPEKNAHSSAG